MKTKKLSDYLTTEELEMMLITPMNERKEVCLHKETKRKLHRIYCVKCNELLAIVKHADYYGCHIAKKE